MHLTDLVRAVPIKHTLGTDKYKNIINVKFSIDLISNDKSLFKNCYYNDNTKTLLIYNNNLHFENNLITINNKYVITIPKTISDYIDIMYILNIELYWSDHIIDQLEPKDYFEMGKIRRYYEEMLLLMDKSKELI